MTTATAESTNGHYTSNDAPPEGFEQVSGDIVAYWEPASPGKGTGKDLKNPEYWYSEDHGFKPGSGPILFTPIDCVLGDSKLEGNKTSTLLFGRLEKPILLKSANEEEGYQTYQPGTIIGIWTKPGMAPLKKLAGIPVWMCNGQEINGKRVLFKDVDKPSPMVQFDIRYKGTGKDLPVREDRRDKSAPAGVKEARAKVTQDMGDIPF
jgi:hypothetical protein